MDNTDIEQLKEQMNIFKKNCKDVFNSLKVNYINIDSN